MEFDRPGGVGKRSKVCSRRSDRLNPSLPTCSLRLADLLRRLRRATTIETGLFEIQAGHLSDLAQHSHVDAASRQIVHALFGEPSVRPDHQSAPSSTTVELQMTHVRRSEHSCRERQVGQTLNALESLDRRKPQERRRQLGVRIRDDVPTYDRNMIGGKATRFSIASDPPAWLDYLLEIAPSQLRSIA